MIRLSTSSLAAALAVVLASPAAAQGTGAALTHHGSLDMSPDQQLGLVVPSPTQRRALFAAADTVLSILKRDDALAKPIGYEVELRRMAGVTEGGDDDHLLGKGLHYAVSGVLAYDEVGDDGHGGKTIPRDGDKAPFSIVVNAPGRLTDAEQLAREPDHGPSVLGNVRQTGVFRGHPVYNGDCVVISGKSTPAFVPLTMERYQKLLILNYRADSAYHTTQNRADLAKHQAAPKLKPPTGKLDANEEQAYEMIKKMDPAASRGVPQADHSGGLGGVRTNAGSGQRARRLDRDGDDSAGTERRWRARAADASEARRDVAGGPTEASGRRHPPRRLGIQHR